jgi:hypothetical protein
VSAFGYNSAFHSRHVIDLHGIVSARQMQSQFSSMIDGFEIVANVFGHARSVKLSGHIASQFAY